MPTSTNTEEHAKYCRLMLLLFKPWRTIDDLRGQHSSWPLAFAEFMESCSPYVRNVLKNLDVLHECKSAQYDHFRERGAARRRRAMASDNMQDSDRVMDDIADADELDVLSHCVDVDRLCTDKLSKSLANAIRCVQYVDQYHVYSGNPAQRSQVPLDSGRSSPDSDTTAPHNISTFIERVSETSLERSWEKVYKERKRVWKSGAASAETNVEHNATVTVGASTDALTATPYISTVSGADAGSAATANMSSVMSIATDVVQHNPMHLIESLVEKWTLNIEQARPFRLITTHAARKDLGQPVDPLRMFLGEPGGTGKSRVISAVKDYFYEMHQDRRFRLASFTGIAAKNISGSTLHSLLRARSVRGVGLGWTENRPPKRVGMKMSPR